MKKFKIVVMLLVAIASVSQVDLAAPETPSKAQQIMARCIRNTRALRRFICTMEVQVHDFGNSPSLTSIEKDRVVYDGPRHIAVRELLFSVSDPDGRDKEALAYPRYYHEIIADGTRYYALDAYQKRYVLHKLNARGVVAETQGAGIFSDFSFGSVLLDNDNKKSVFPTTEVKIVGDQVPDNTICDKIQHVESNGMPDGSKEKVDSIYWISRKDGLLRRVEVKFPSMRIVESYSFQQVGKAIPQSEFSIKPPPTAQQVKSFE